MGKNNKKKNKGASGVNSPEALKNLGNEEYARGNYEEAIGLYTRAIELDDTNPVFFSNRAQAHITMGNFSEAIADCDIALKIDQQFIKAYFRKALAINQMTQLPDSQTQTIALLEKVIEMDPENSEAVSMLAFAKQELKDDSHVPVAEEKERFEALFEWMRQDGATFDKLKLRYYGPDYRGVHAARDIKQGETILFVPRKEIITLEMAIESPIGQLMNARDFRRRLISPKHSFLATYIMQEKRKKNSYFEKYIDILPKCFNNFPIFYTKEERNWLDGSPF